MKQNDTFLLLVLMPKKTVVYWNLLHKERVPTGYDHTRKKTLTMANMCAVSKLEHQFSTLCLLRAPTWISLYGNRRPFHCRKRLQLQSLCSKGSPCGFNCHGSRGAPKKWPKYRTPTCVRHAVQGCFLVGGFRLPGPPSQNTRTLNREADELHLSNCITRGKLIPKTRLITLYLGN